MKREIPLLIIALLAIPVSVVFASSRSHESSAKPSVVLVHGAWADGSSWNRVISGLQDEGFSVFAVANPLRGLSGDPTQVFNFVPLPNQDVDLYVKPSLFPSCFANDLPEQTGAILASTARPLTFSTFADKSGAPAWKTIPSWYLVGTVDKVIPPFAQLFMAQRINAHIEQVRGSHLVMISHPDAVVDLIDQANQSIQEDLNTGSQETLAPVTPLKTKPTVI